MKKYICIIFGITILACAQEANKTQSEAADYEDSEISNLDELESNLESKDKEESIVTEIPDLIEDMEIDENIIENDDKDSYSFSIPKNPIMDITEQKVEEYFDLIQLKKQHPEFNEDIILQLQKFSDDTSIGDNYSKSFNLENIRIAKTIKTISDSTQKLKLYFDVIQEHSRIKDSIYALIKQKPTIIDGNETVSYKVTFKKD